MPGLFILYTTENIEMTENDLYTYHEVTFKPIYADLVAVLGNKPERIAFELEAALSHIAVAHTKRELFDENIQKAFDHLQRASLDAAKILWLSYKERAEEIIKDEYIRTFAANISEKELLNQFFEAEKKAKEARKHELENTGENPSASINLYYEAANLFCEVVSHIDIDKKDKLRKFSSIIKRKEVIISFIVGLLSSAAVSILIELIWQ